MLTFLGNVWGEAWRGFIRWPLRTMAPALGIMISTAALVSIISVDEAWEASLWRQYRSKGLETIQIGLPKDVALKRRHFEISDALWLRSHCPAVKEVSWAAAGFPTILSPEQTSTQCSLLAVTLDYPRINGWSLLSGRWFTKEDFSAGAPVCLLGAPTAKRLFGKENPLGKTLGLNGANYTVIGTALFPDDLEQDLSGLIIIPYTEKAKTLPLGDLIYISAAAKNVAALQAAHSQINRALSARFGLADDKAAFCRSNWQELQTLLIDRGRVRAFYILGMMLLLLTGCFGISSVLMAGLAERTQEIGLKRALGASLWQMYGAIVMEGLLIAFTGGILGIVLSLGLTSFIARLLVVDVSDIMITARSFRSVMFAPAGLYPGVSVSAIFLTLAILFAASLVAAASAASPLHNLPPITLLGAASQPRSKFLFPLTILQGGLGIAVVLVLISLYQGIGRNEIIHQRKLFGYNRLAIEGSPEKTASFSKLVRDQNALDQLLKGDTEITAIAGSSLLKHSQVSNSRIKINPCIVMLVTSHYFAVCSPNEKKLLSGRLPTPQEMETGKPVVLLTESAAQQLGKNKTVIGETLTINGQEYTVIGELAGSNNIIVPIIFIPANSAPYYAQSDMVGYAIYATMREEKHFEQAKAQLAKALQNRLHLSPAENSMLLRALYAPARPLYNIIAQTEKASLRAGAVGLLALLVACMGIFNLLLIAVQEDIWEVGLRRAVGATRARIGLTYAWRGLSITLAAALLGALLGWLLATGLAFITKMPTYVPVHWMLIAGGALILLGGFTTFLPAYLASRIPPAAALRHE